MAYEIGFKPSALREIRKLDESTRQSIVSEIELLADNPRPDGCKKLKVKTTYTEFVSSVIIVLFTKYRIVSW